jgi:signal transduction histidine kinase
LEIDDEEIRKRDVNGFPKRKTITRVVRSFFASVHFKYIVIPSIVLSIVTLTVTIDPNRWVVSDIDHFYFEIFAVILSAIVAFYCITRAYTLKEKFSLFVGVGFLTNAVIDFLHAVLSYGAAGNSDFLFYFIPQTWIAGRTFLGAMLVIAVAKYAPKVWQQAKQQIAEEKPPRIHSWNNKGNKQKGNFRYDDYNDNSNSDEDNNKDNYNNLLIAQGEEKFDRSLLLSLSVLAFLAISLVVVSSPGPFTGQGFQFPSIVIASAPVYRPYESASLVLFSIALFLFYKKRLYNSSDAFYKGILAALIVDVFGQLTMAYSAVNFHTAHNVAHILKDSGYFMIILSLAVSSIQYNKIAKQEEATIRVQYNRLKEIDKMKDEFINVAAHELRTPIQPIIGLSELLKSRMRNNTSGNKNNGIYEEDQEFIDVILRNGKRLEKLVDDVLDASKIESRSLQLNKEHFDLNDLIISIIDDILATNAESMAYGMVTRHRNKNNVKIIYQPQHLLLYADKNRIAQVVHNLLNNALKFTSEGSIEITADKKVHYDNKVAIISVRDSGSGVDSEIMPRLFTKFSSKSFSGTGLGLYISKNIVEAHGGRIWAENNKDGKGATFSFTLPAAN